MEQIIETEPIRLSELGLGRQFQYGCQKWKVIGIKNEMVQTDTSTYSSSKIYVCEGGDGNRTVIELPSTTQVNKILLKLE